MRARALRKSFGRNLALADATFELPERGVVGLLGPNGAGKTTTIRLIAGVFAPDSGALEIAGIDPARHPARARAAVGYLPESAPLAPELTARETVRFRGRLAGLRGRALDAAVDESLSRCDATRFADRCGGTLSKGMQQRVGLAAAIVGDPRVLILDEPSVGLDPSQTLVFRDLVRTLGASRLVVFSTHLLAEVESLCERLVVLAAGRVVADETMAAFRARAAAGAPLVAVTDRRFAGLGDARALFGAVEDHPLTDGWIRTSCRTPASPDAAERLARILLREGIAAREIGIASAPLEEVFVSLVRAEDPGGEARRRDGTPVPALPPREATS